jgi:hypothetical protein
MAWISATWGVYSGNEYLASAMTFVQNIIEQN